MAFLDWLVIGLFFVALIGIVVWVARQKQGDAKDYFLGGKDATWIAIGASIFASNIGSEHLIGLAGSGASSGMAMAHWEIQGWMILILGWVFVPFYSRSMVYTMPEFLERRFNPASRTILSLISLISYVLTKVAVTVYAGGLVFQQVFGIDTLWGIDFFWIAAIGLVLITAVYTIFGGMKSVLYTSVLQTPILLLGSLVILVLGLKELGGWDEMMRICSAVEVNEYGDTMTNLIRDNRDAQYPWLGALIGSAVIGFWYWCTDQFIVQRVLSGKNEKEARRGTIFGAYLKLLPVFLFLIPGMIAFALHQTQGSFLPLLPNGNPNSDAAFPTLVAKLLPAGFKGLIVCGILDELISIAVQLQLRSVHHRLLQALQTQYRRQEAGAYRPGRYGCDRDFRYPLDSHHAFGGRCALSVSSGCAVGAGTRYRGRVPVGYPVEALHGPGRYVGADHRSADRYDATERQGMVQQRRSEQQHIPLCILRDQLAVLLRMDAGDMLRRRHHRVAVYQSPGSQADTRTGVRNLDCRAARPDTPELERMGCDTFGYNLRYHGRILHLFLVKQPHRSLCIT